MNLNKYFTTFVLLLFHFNVFWYYMPYLIMRSEIRNKMREKAEEEPEDELLFRLNLSATDQNKQPEWIMEGKEFLYQDEMYDVVKIENLTNGVTYF